jgi:septal ring factor EnvC (AmiA/AmiB activator)
MKNQSSINKRLQAMQYVAAALVIGGLCAAMPAHAQDVRGLEVCTAEKQMDRRTSCLQANTEFLQTAIERSARDARQKLDAAGKELASARNEIAALKAALAATQARLDKLEKAEKPAPRAK